MVVVRRPVFVLGAFEPHGLRVEEGVVQRQEAWQYCVVDAEETRSKAEQQQQQVGVEEELFIHANTVLWISGKQVRKRFTSPLPVLHALWTPFPSLPHPLLCLLHPDSLTTHCPSGHSSSVPLPYPLSSIWPLPVGLLLQRSFHAPPPPPPPCPPPKPSPRDPLPSSLHRFSPTRIAAHMRQLSRTSEHPLCTSSSHSSHATLQHPCEEPRPLRFEEASDSSCSGSGRRDTLDAEESIVWTCARSPYAVSYHATQRQHSIWILRSIEEEKSYAFAPTGASWECPESSSYFCLRRVWQDRGMQSVAHKVFLASDSDGMPVLCITLKDFQTLVAFRLVSQKMLHGASSSIPNLEVAWSIPAIDSVPTIATQTCHRKKGGQHFDIITLAPTGKLYLNVGQHQLCELYLPAFDIECMNCGVWTSETKRTVAFGSSKDQPQIVGLKDPVKGRFNAVMSSGQLYRCAVTPVPASTLTALCINALAEGLPRTSYHHLLVSLWGHDIPEGEASGTIYFDAGSKPDLEWTAFCAFLMQLCGKNHTVMGDKASSSSWDFLLGSSIHKRNVATSRYASLLLPITSECTDAILEPKPCDPAMLLEIVEVLHAMYEDSKLDTLRWGDVQLLACLLANLAASISQWNYVDYYARDFPILFPLLSKRPLQPPPGPLKDPPNLFQWLEDCLRDKVAGMSNLCGLLLRECSDSVDWSRKVVAFFELLCGADLLGTCLPSGVHVTMARGSAHIFEQRVVLAMVAEEFGLPELDRLPPGVSLPLRHALDRCREAPPADWPAAAFVLVGREDLASTCLEKPVIVNAITMAAPYMLHLRPVPIIPCSASLHDAIDTDASPADEIVIDGMEQIFNVTTQLRFGRDLRLNEVRRMLCSSKPVAVRMASPPDISDPDIVAQQQTQLLQLAHRTTTLPFGRGAFTLATSRTFLTEPLPIPKLVLAGRLPLQHDATVNLDASTGNLSDLTSWPEFHNGVAAGLRLAPCQAKISRTWIVYNKPVDASYSHAGLLMSLGLHSHLKVLSATDVFQYLSQEHEATTVGILLGMSAAYRGTMDQAISKMLYLHIPALHPPSFPELELPTLMQSAALMAVGILYQGSAHRLTTEILIAEIGRKPGGNVILEREGYALAAGLALGLVTLGRGKDALGLADLKIEERLRHYMSGGADPGEERHKFNRIRSTMSSASRSVEGLFHNNSQLMEGTMLNVDVTAPGATLALGLMFLKTNDLEVANRLAIPETHFALEYVRPDFILLRVVSRSLIMWDSVQPNEEWVQAQVPPVIQQVVSALKDGPEALQYLRADVDAEALMQAHAYILAGACLSIGLRYAGTFNADAQELLYRYALQFLKEKRSAAPFSGAIGPNGQYTYVDRATFETCLNIAVLSLSTVMAGSGNLETFRLLRYLRHCRDSDGTISYGNHIAVSMGLGFLFLGGGTLTFCTNNNAIAALLISLYPRFPTAPSDHRCYLQAFRHLYVLATEARCVQTVDVDTGLPVYVPLEITVGETTAHSETAFSRVTPCILPERSMLKRVRVCGPRYWPQNIELFPSDLPWWTSGDNGDPFNGGVLYVKRKVGAHSYMDDPIGCRSLLSRTRQKVSEQGNNVLTTVNCQAASCTVDQLVSTFSADPSMLGFAQLCCDSSRYVIRGSNFEEFCSEALLECVSMDRPALLQVYLSLYTTVETFINYATGSGGTLSNISSASLSVRGLKVALAYVQAVGSVSTQLHGPPQVQPTFLVALAKRMEELFSMQSFLIENSLLPNLAKYLNGTELPSCSSSLSECRPLALFACYLCWYNIPYPLSLKRALKKLCYCLPGIFSVSSGSSDNLPLLAVALPGTPTSGLIYVNKCLPLIDITF